MKKAAYVGKYICLVKISSPKEERSLFIESNKFTIGRSPEADIQTYGKGTSRIHLAVQIKDGGLWLEDLETTHGTEVSGKKVPPQSLWPYKSGEPLKLGTSDEILTLDLATKIGDVGTRASFSQESHEPDEKTVVDHEFGGLLVEEAKIEAERILREATEKADAESKAMIQKAEAKVRDLKKQAAENADAMIKEALSDALKLKIGSESDAAKIMQHAKNKAMTDIIEGQEKADALLEAARKQIPEIKREIEEEAESMRRAFETAAASLNDEAQRQAEQIRKEAQDKGAEIIEEHRVTARKILSEARTSANSIKIQAQKESNELINSANQRAGTIKDVATGESESLLQRTKEKVTILVNESVTEAEGILNEARQGAGVIRSKIELELEELKKKTLLDGQKGIAREREKVLETAKFEGEKIRAQVVEKANGEASAILTKVYEDQSALLDAKHKILEELKTLEHTHSKLTQSNQSLLTKTKDLQNHHLETTTLLQKAKEENSHQTELLKKTQAELARSRKEHEAMVSAVKSAEARKHDIEKSAEALAGELAKFKDQIKANDDTVKQKMTQAEKEIKKLKEAAQKEVYTLKSEVQAQVQEFKNKADISFQERKRREEQEINQSKLREIEEAKNRRKQEDDRLLVHRRNQVLEIAKNLELLLNAKRDRPHGALFGEISEIVKNVMNEEMAVPLEDKIPVQVSKKKIAVVLGLALWALVTITALVALKRESPSERNPAEESFSEKNKKEQAKPKFNPPQTDVYKSSYTDNILYTTNYLESKMDPEYQKQWIVALNKFFINDLRIEETTTVRFVSMETGLVGRLRYLKEHITPGFEQAGIARMTEFEVESMPAMKSLLGGEKKFEKFQKFDKTYFVNFQNRKTGP